MTRDSFEDRLAQDELARKIIEKVSFTEEEEVEDYLDSVLLMLEQSGLIPYITLHAIKRDFKYELPAGHMTDHDYVYAVRGIIIWHVYPYLTWGICPRGNSLININ